MFSQITQTVTYRANINIRISSVYYYYSQSSRWKTAHEVLKKTVRIPRKSNLPAFPLTDTSLISISIVIVKIGVEVTREKGLHSRR